MANKEIDFKLTTMNEGVVYDKINLTLDIVKFLGSLNIIQWWRTKDNHFLEVLDVNNYKKFMTIINKKG